MGDGILKSWYWGLNSGPRISLGGCSYHLSHSTSPFLWWVFQDRVSRTICLGQASNPILLISASCIARITDVSHQCLAFLSFHFFFGSISWSGYNRLLPLKIYCTIYTFNLCIFLYAYCTSIKNYKRWVNTLSYFYLSVTHLPKFNSFPLPINLPIPFPDFFFLRY
jgi:hypothetical protein